MSMRLVLTSIAATLLAGVSGALAADLSGDPYDDPRYAEIYDDAPPPPRKEYIEKYEERFERREYEHDDREDRYAEYRSDDHDGACVPRHVIRRELRADGWHDFNDLELRGSVALLQARRPSGRLFDLKVDRCSGRIVHARPLDAPRYDRFAYEPRRHWRY